MASTSTSAKPTSRFSSFKVFKFAGSSSKAPPPPPPPKDANYVYSATNPSVLSFSNQSLSLDAAYASQPPTPLSPSMPPAPQPSVRSPSPAPSRATQSNGPSSSSSSTLSPDPSAAAAAAGFRKGFMKVASLGKRTFTPKSPRFPPADELAPPEPRDDESISLPWGFQHHVHVDEEYAGFPSSWSSSLAEAGFTQDEIAGFMQARRVRSPSALIPLPLSRAQSPAPSAFSALHRQRSDASLSRSERSHRFATPEPPPPLPTAAAAASSVPRGAPRKFSNASSSTRADPSFDRSYSEIDAAESIAAYSDTQYVYVDRANLRQSSATMMSVATIRPGGSAPAPAPAPSPSATSTFSVASGLPRNPRPMHATQPVPIPTQTQTQPSAHQQRSRVRTPPRKVFRVVNETPPGRRSPPPAYKSPSRDDLRADDHLGSRNASSEDMRSTAAPPPLTASDLRRAAPAEKQAAREGSRADTDARDEGDEGEGEEEDEVGETSKRFSRPPPRLSVLPPRLSLRQDTIDDLSSWTESLFSSIPSGLSTTATATSGGFSLSELAGTPTSTSTSQSSVSVSASVPSPSPSPARRRTLKDSPNRKIPIPDITLSLTPERARGANDGDDDADEPSFHLSASPLYNELMGMMQDRAPLPAPVPAPASGSSASSHSSSSSLSYPSYPSFGRASPSPAPGSPALSESPFMPSSPVSAAAFHAHLAAATATATATARDSAHSQLTITPPRQKDRDSSMSTASGSTVTHATIVHGASVVRSVQANVVPARVRGLAQAQARAREDVNTDEEEEDEEEEEDVPTLPPSPALPAALRLQQQQQQQQQQQRRPRPASRASSRSRSSGSSSAGSGSNYDFSGSPRQTLSMTSGSNSLEDGGALKSPGLGAFVRTSSPLSSPSAARTSFGADAFRDMREPRGGRARARGGEGDGEGDGDGDSDVEPAARPSIVITTDVQTSKGLHSGTTAAPAAAPTRGPPSARARSPSPSPSPSPSLAPTSTRAQRYPPWLAEALKPLAEFIDAEADPRALFADLQEIAEGESGSVYSALVGPDADSTSRTAPSTTTGSGSRSRLASASAFPRARANERVAIKHVALVPGGSQKLGDLRRELELLPRGARHPHVLQMEGLYVDLVENSLWIGMELMERSLADMLGVGADAEDEEENGPRAGAAAVGAVGAVTITENMIARFAWDVLLALSYLQKQHIGHRDLRSDNLLVNRDGVLKIADFSSAVHAPPGTPKTSENVGVIYWQAPEIRTGLYDPLRVDVWSLGATAWELVEREPPFSDVVDTRQIGLQLPPLSDPESHSRSFHDFLHSCCQPVSSRPDPDELLSAPFIRTACPRSAIVRLLAQCRAVEERLLHRRLSFDSQGTIS